MRLHHPFLIVQALLLIQLTSPGTSAQALEAQASADEGFFESLQLHLEGGGDAIAGGTPSDRFKPGGHVRGHLSFPIVSALHVQLGTGSWWFPAEEGDVGRLISAEAGLRFSPMADPGPRGLFIDANGGLGLTGDLERPMLSVGLGWQFPLSDSTGLGPVVRYTQVFQPDSESGPDDARLLGLGVVLSLGIPRREAAQEPDTDGDGLRGERDHCPKEAEDSDGFQDDDGCPDPDNDKDGILDADDRCPDASETHNDYKDEDGCPDEPPPPPPEKAPEASSSGAERAKGTPMEQVVRFNYRSHRILGSEEAAIRSVCDDLSKRTGVRVRVHGHADEAGSEGYNHELSAERAGNVARWLVRCGVDGSRIVVQADGENFPICTEQTSDCAARNRRVEFEILDE